MGKNYIPVLCCSSKKNKGFFLYKKQSIKFVASPIKAPGDGCIYYRPDDIIPGENKTWRDLVLEQKEPDLVPAYLLYCPPDVYHGLYRKFRNRFYILSAGWGIIRADFKIPAYDITYSTAQKVPNHARRTNNYGWKDINHLKEDAADFKEDPTVILFAGSDYVHPFCKMTESIQNRKKIILFNSKKFKEGKEGDFEYKQYRTNTKTNWHIEAAKRLMETPEYFTALFESTNQGSHKKPNDQKKPHNTSREIFAYSDYPYSNDKNIQEIKSKYHELCAAYHPDHLNEKDKASGQRVFCEGKDSWDNKNYIKLENIYEKYQKAKSGEIRREPRKKEQFYNQQGLYDDYAIDQKIVYESNHHRSESKNIFKALLVSIIASIILVNIMQGCPTRKEPNRTTPPRVEYVLPTLEGSSIVVKSDILTKHFGISYEQRQSSNLFMKDSHEYRYNGNGTWTITKKGAINNTNKNYIDTNNKNEVENYLHSLGF
jgi:hypothetical protein